MVNRLLLNARNEERLHKLASQLQANVQADEQADLGKR